MKIASRYVLPSAKALSTFTRPTVLSSYTSTPILKTQPEAEPLQKNKKMLLEKISNCALVSDNRFVAHDHLRLSGFLHFVRPSLLMEYLPGEDLEAILQLLQEMFPQHWKRLTIANNIVESSCKEDIHRVDWLSTVWINNHHNDILKQNLFGLLEQAERYFFSEHKQDFFHTHIPTRNFPLFQARFFSTDSKAPTNNATFELTRNNYEQSDIEARTTPTGDNYSLASIVPNIDESCYSIGTLKQFTEAKFNDIHTYLSHLNEVRSYHPKLSNDESFKSLQRNLLTINDLHNVLFSIDLEAYEKNNNNVTEVGITIYDPLKEAGSIIPNFTKIHIIIAEHEHFKNGQYVQDNQQFFIGGTSIILSQHETVAFVQSLIDHYFIERQQIGMRGVIVGHSVVGDMKWLRGIGVKFPNLLHVVDTQKIYNIVNGDKFSGLGAVLRRFNIPHSYLHNAGNDAYFTMILALKLGDVSFRDRIKLDDFNSDLKFVENFEKLRTSQFKKFEKQKKREKSIYAKDPKNARSQKTIRKKADTFDFTQDEKFNHHSHALRKIFN